MLLFGGQRIALSSITCTPILLLDEATSALDIESEYLIHLVKIIKK